MRRKVGVSIVKSKKDELQKFNKMGKSLEETKLSFVQDVLSSFRSSLAEFASKHKDRINSDPEFRQQFHKMCVSVGVDPLASNKGFWADVLGLGDFYFELGVKIIQVAVQTRTSNGGIMALDDMLLRLRRMNTCGSIASDDIVRSIEKISVLGSGFKIVQLNGRPMIISVPIEINSDHEALLGAAQDEGGCITLEMIIGLHGWSKERFHMNIQPLMKEGIVWIDKYKGLLASLISR